MSEFFPIFLNLTGRTVVLVGGGPVATAKLRQLLAAGAIVRVVAPEIDDEILNLERSFRLERGFQPRGRGPERAALQARADLTIAQRAFVPADLDAAWLVVAAATPEVNRDVAEAAEARRLFVNAVDDPAHASAFLGGVVRRDGVTLAISTSGAAPALAALLREGIDALLPSDLATWMWRARAERAAWRREGVPIEARKPRLLEALNDLYRSPEEPVEKSRRGGGAALYRSGGGTARGVRLQPDLRAPAEGGHHADAAVPWLSGPEDSWL